MTTLLRNRPAAGRWTTALLPAKRGYLGIDIGTQSIKLAQVSRSGRQWQLAAKWLLPLPPVGSGDVPESLDRVLAHLDAELPDLRYLFGGRRAAVALPLSLSNLRSMEIPRGSDPEMRAMVREELADEFAGSEGFEFDYWEMAPSDVSASEGVTQLAALATRHQVIQRLTAGLRSAGLECQVLDGMSCVLARAVALADPMVADQPSLALDLGYSSPHVVICRSGRPTFCRTLPACGMETLMQPIRDRLDLSDEQCQQLIHSVGIPLDTPQHRAPSATRTVFQLIFPRLERLAQELKRTLSYISHQFPDQVPRRVTLFGGGALLPGLAEYLSASLGLPVAPWHPHSHRAAPCDPQFAAAIALSLLAFQQD